MKKPSKDLDKILEELIGNHSKRKTYLEILHEILVFTQEWTDQWSVYEHGQGIILVAGSLIICHVGSDNIFLSLDKEMISKNNFSKEIRKELEKNWHKGEYPEYVRGVKTKNFDYLSGSKDFWEEIKDTHFEVIRKISRRRHYLRPDSQKNHQAILLDSINENFETKILPPKWKNFHWIFYCNPKHYLNYYDELSQLKKGDVSSWKVSNSNKDEFAAGQFGVVRVWVEKSFQDKTKFKRGIYAIVEVLGNAIEADDKNSINKLQPNGYGTNDFMVKIKYLEILLDRPILLEDLKNDIDFEIYLKRKQAPSQLISKISFDKIVKQFKIKISKVNSLVKNNFLEEEVTVILDNHTKKYTEGQLRLIKHLRRERNRKVVEEAKKLWKKEGNLKCAVCDFSFSSYYGDYGEDYIEAHHKDKLGDINSESTETSVDDLAPLCANCHRIIHRYNPMLSIKKLKEVVKNNKRL